MGQFLGMFLVLAGLAVPLATALAEGPADTVPVLHIEGKLAGGKALDFTRADLEKLGMTTVRTTTPWHDGVQTFEGVALSRLLSEIGAEGTQIEILALDKFRTELPVADLAKFHPVLALKRNGQIMDVKDKGPLFVIYPFDDFPELKSEQYYARCAWQIRSMKVM